MEEEEEGPGKFFTLLVVLVALGLGLSIGAVLVFNLQPRLTGGGQGGGGITIVLPTGVGSDQSLNYQPSKITVVIGVNNTIQWLDKDSIPHTVTSMPGSPSSFGSGTLNQGDAFSVKLTSPGTYGYFCQFHPGWMKGTITVKAASG